MFIVAGLDQAKRSPKGNLTNHIKCVELHPGEQIKGTPGSSVVTQRRHEPAVDFVDEWLVRHQRTHRVHIGRLPPFDCVLRIARLGEDIFVVDKGRSKGDVKIRLVELGAGAINRADHSRIADTITVGC